MWRIVGLGGKKWERFYCKNLSNFINKMLLDFTTLFIIGTVSVFSTLKT